MKLEDVKKKFKQMGGRLAKKFVPVVLSLSMIASVAAFTVSCGNKDEDKEPSKVVETPIEVPDKPTPEDPTPDKPTPDDPTIVDPTPEDPTPVDPTPVEDLDATAEDISKFEEVLAEKVGEIDGYDFIDGNFYCYGKSEGNTVFYSFKLSEDSGFEKKKEVESLTEDVENIQKLFTINSEKSYVEYLGKKYNINSIKGQNIFASRLGIQNDQSITTVQIKVEENEASMDVVVVTGTKTTIGKVSTTSLTALTEEDALDLLTNEAFSDIETQEIPFGTDTSKIASEVPENIETPVVDPDDPVEELNFTNLEEKIKENAESITFVDFYDMMGYSVVDGDFYVLAEMCKRNRSNSIFVLKLEGDYSVESQTEIDKITTDLGTTDFTILTSIQKAQSDITFDEYTFSKDGIEGDNPFAQSSGVENPILTFVGEVSTTPSYADTETGYGNGVQVLVIYEKDGNIYANKKTIVAESDHGYTREQNYKNAITPGKYYIETKTTANKEIDINLGQLIGGSLAENTKENESELTK